METITIDNDIVLLCVTAASFPAGVMEAHQKLHSLIPFSEHRKYYGISRPENGAIVYKAAAEELTPGEGKQLDCETVVLKKGKYISTVIHDYMKDLPSIGRAFEQLLAQPGLDPQGYCVEWYVSQTEVNCMIRLEEQ
jgi:hypothetical protein